MRVAEIDNMITGVRDRFNCYTIEEYPYIQIPFKLLKCKHKSKGKAKEYLKAFATFDIESTTIQPDPEEAPEGFMYHWQMDIAGVIVYGRRWEEWIELLKGISSWLELNEERRMIIYVHNLSYEFQFIKDICKKYFDDYRVFAAAPRKVIYLTTGNGFEFRCSYKLTNMSLARATLNELGIKHIKAAGDLDYRQIRTADTVLSDTEFGYCIADVVSLYELIERRLINEKDTLETIPLTNTGYVRRECRSACRSDPDYRKKVFNKNLLTPDVYILLKEAGRGGDTHANRFLSGRIWPDVDSFDGVSQYPSMMQLKKFPMTKFTYYGDVETDHEFRKLLKENACLFRVSFTNIRIKRGKPMPYIPSSKILERGHFCRYDNGRLLEASWIYMTVTDIDYKIIEQQYDFDEDIGISDFYIAKYDYLPASLRGQVMNYFKAKCELKEKIKNETDPEELANLNYLYAKSKNRLNGIFGMCYTDPVRALHQIDDQGQWFHEMPDIEESLNNYNKSKNSFLIYAWGVWVTAWARYHLQQLYNMFGRNVIYGDTDSGKGMLTPAIKKKIDNFNNKMIRECEKLGAYCDVNGDRYYMGLYEHETKKGSYKFFKSLGAKKYAYVDHEGKFHITISGVQKKTGAEEMGGIENFNIGFIFRRAGGMTLYYNEAEEHEIIVDNCEMKTFSNIGMIESEYTLGVTKEYGELIGLNVYREV